MWKNYFTASLRFFKKYKGYTFLNLIGLSIGIASSILILLWVLDELSYDKFHKNYKHIYRLVYSEQSSRGTFKAAKTPAPYPQAFKEILPEIKDFFRVRPSIQGTVVENNNKKFIEENLLYADSSILKILSFEFIYGDVHSLNELNSVIITESTAKKYFGSQNPYGETLIIDNTIPLKITGVVKDFPSNSHLKFDFLLNFGQLVRSGLKTNWYSRNYFAYFLLEDNVNIRALNNKLCESLANYMNTEQNLNISAELLPDLYVQPLKDIHLYSDFNIDLYSQSQPKIQYVYFFSIIGFLILIITAINYTNLAIARYSKRSVEVGIRKVCGSYRNHLTFQFLFESILLSFTAYLVGVFLVEIFIPKFNQFTDKNLFYSYSDWRIIVGAISIILFTGILSGSYPALFLSSLSPISAIKGIKNRTSSTFRKMLVIIQFSLGSILIIGTITVKKQMEFIKNKDLGLNKENIIYIPTMGNLVQKFQVFKQELEKSANIKEVTYSSALPTYTVHSTEAYWGDGQEKIIIYQEKIEHDYLKTFDIKLNEGRVFEKSSSIDSSNYIINEAAAKLMGLENPLGEKFTLSDKKGRIIGVMKDFNFKSLHMKVEPLVYQIGDVTGRYILIRLNGNNLNAEIKTVRNIYEEVNPAYPFEFHFLNEEYDKLYKTEEKTGTLFSGFSIIAIFLACLGFFGLASYMAEQKSKEIAIRKIYGSSSHQIAYKLIWNFTQWIIIANIIAIPFAYYVLNNWLNKFAYQISIGYQVFVLTVLFTIIIAISAQMVQVIKAINKNPVDALKYE